MGNLIDNILSFIGGEGGGSVNVPDVPLPVLKEINPELYKQVVRLNPELEHAINLGPSAMEGISTDPRLRQAQMNALSKMMEIGDAGGRDAQFMADAYRAQNDVNSNLQGNSQAIQQNMAMRGMSGGMSEMVNKQLASQGAANRQAQVEMDLNAQAQQRALQALMNGANLGGQIQSQDFNQQSAVAQAKDTINKFNTTNLQQVNSNNTNYRNNAQQWNANTAQGVSDNNTGASNQAKQYNAGLPQQDYENKMKRAGLQMSADEAEQQREEARRNGNLGFAGNLISGGMMAYGASKKGTT